MANGERLSDNRATFAAWRDKLNTTYLLRNTENELQTKAELTDRGNFDGLGHPEPWKIASNELRERSFDLSLATSKRLGNIKTSDNTLVDFNKLDCG